MRAVGARDQAGVRLEATRGGARRDEGNGARSLKRRVDGLTPEEPWRMEDAATAGMVVLSRLAH